MFIWLFHRISGLALILLIGVKIVSGYALSGEIELGNTGEWHVNKAIDIAVLFLFIFHSLYGIRTIIIDTGVKKERLLFWIFNITAVVAFVLCYYWIYI